MQLLGDGIYGVYPYIINCGRDLPTDAYPCSVIPYFPFWYMNPAVESDNAPIAVGFQDASDLARMANDDPYSLPRFSTLLHATPPAVNHTQVTDDLRERLANRGWIVYFHEGRDSNESQKQILGGYSKIVNCDDGADPNALEEMCNGPFPTWRLLSGSVNDRNGGSTRFGSQGVSDLEDMASLPY